MKTRLVCVNCGRKYFIVDRVFRCACNGLLEARHDERLLSVPVWKNIFSSRWGEKNLPYASGVWRYREAVMPSLYGAEIVSLREGNTRLYDFPRLTSELALSELQWKHEGENPTGSFKDRGMTVAVSWAKFLGVSAVICASTGNTAASAAAYAAEAGIRACVLLPETGIALGKISQALSYGALVLRVRGNFDDAMKMIESAAGSAGIYPLNSLNPLRLEGQKTIVWEIFEQRNWQPPDWIILPGGNLGNTAAFGKALRELVLMGILNPERVPRLAVVQASGANPFYRSYKSGFSARWIIPHAQTIATAIKIGIPVNYDKAVNSIRYTDGVVFEASDEEIMEAKARLDRCGVGAEPASAATLAGLRKLRAEGIVKKGQSVVCVLTGHALKDPEATIDFHEKSDSAFANKPITINPDLEELERIL